METLVLVAHVVLAVALIALVLLQQGKGAEAGAAFGGGASQTMFGSQGTGSFLARVTAVIATGIFLTSFALAVIAKQRAEGVSEAGIPSPVEEVQREVPAESPQTGGSDVPGDVPTTD